MSSTAQREDLENEVARLRSVVEELQGRLDQIDGSQPMNGESRRTRRDLLKVAGAAVAGAAGGVLLGAQPAAATDGNALILGNTDTGIAGGAKVNDAAFTTSLTATTGTTPSPLFEVVGPGATVPTGTGAPPLAGVVQAFAANSTAAPGKEAIDGWGPGAYGAGIQGFSDSGYGVIGDTSTGVDLAAYGSGRIYQYSLTDNTGAAVAGPPTFTPAQPASNQPGGELMRDVNGVIWASLPTGTAQAAWRRMNTVRFDNPDGSNTVFKPVRVVDTRINKGATGPLASNSKTTFPIAGLPGTNIPADAIAVVGNLTAVGYGQTQGYLAIFPAGATYTPGTDPSTVNYGPPVYAWANSFMVGLGGGAVTVYVYSTQHIIIDIVAYIQ